MHPANLISELVRVTRQNGIIIVSTLNVSNLHSRSQFHGASPGRGHVSPFTPLQLIYVFGAMGCTLKDIRIGRCERMALLPFYLLLKHLSILWTRKITGGTAVGTYPALRVLAAS